MPSELTFPLSSSSLPRFTASLLERAARHVCSLASSELVLLGEAIQRDRCEWDGHTVRIVSAADTTVEGNKNGGVSKHPNAARVLHRTAMVRVRLSASFESLPGTGYSTVTD